MIKTQQTFLRYLRIINRFKIFLVMKSLYEHFVVLFKGLKKDVSEFLFLQCYSIGSLFNAV